MLQVVVPGLPRNLNGVQGVDVDSERQGVTLRAGKERQILRSGVPFAITSVRDTQMAEAHANSCLSTESHEESVGAPYRSPYT